MTAAPSVCWVTLLSVRVSTGGSHLGGFVIGDRGSGITGQGWKPAQVPGLP